VPVAATVALLQACEPIYDVDAFWHVVIGDEIRQYNTVQAVGDSWAWYSPSEQWVTSQWASEAAMSWLVQELGWKSLVIVQLVLAGVAVALLYWVIASRATARVGATLFTAVVIPLGSAFQVRPALLSLMAVIVVGHVADLILRHGYLPRWWIAGPLVMIWANFHGAWILAPAVLGVAAALHWLESPRQRREFAVRAAVVGLAMLAAGVITPIGLDGLLLPLLFRDAARVVNEWQPTELWGIAALELTAVLLFTVVAWARSGTRVPWTEVAYVVVWTTFGMLAFRNVSVAAVILAPLAAFRATSTFPASRAVTSPTERRLLLGAISGMALVGAALVLTAAARVDPLADTRALRIAELLAPRDGTVTVLNDYNTAGTLIAFGPQGIQVGIDGRTDRYGADYIRRYLDAVAMRGDEWRSLLSEMQPDAAVLEDDAPLRYVLEEERGWTVTLTDGAYVLLEPADG
jgi:hypothetical protein